MASNSSSGKSSGPGRSGRSGGGTRQESGGHTFGLGRKGASGSGSIPGLSSVSLAFDGRGHDAAGLVLLGAAILVAFGVYGEFGGPVGRLFRTVLTDFLGVFRYLAPVALAAIGVVLVRGPREDAEPAGPRAPVGWTIIALSAMAITHLAVSPRPMTRAGIWRANDSAAGLIGWAAGQPLHALAGRWGGLVIASLAGLFGVSLVTGRSLWSMLKAVNHAAAPAGRGARTAVAALFRLGPAPPLDGEAFDDEGVDPDAPTRETPGGAAVFDQDAASTPPPARVRSAKPPRATGPKVVVPVDDSVDPEQLQIDLEAVGPWRLPSPKLLSRSVSREVDTAGVEERGRRLEAALSEHGVETRLVGMVVGPTVTRYELELGVGVKVAKVTNLHRDIAYALASPDVRVIAPIPGRQAIGVEVPNDERSVVALGDILASEEAVKAKHPLEVGIGRDINGRSVMVNLATMPHVLIAGQTGAGKSSCLNSILTSLMMRATPDVLGMLLIDPKRVELTQYDRIPHLVHPVVTNPKKAANALDWMVREMERRYDLLSEVGCRDIGGYNAAFDRGELVTPLGEDRELHRLKFLLVVVDELADLMMVAARDVENSICRLAQMARAVGIHLVIATQRPSVNVITGVIKANVPARMAFSVASATDSKVILDQGGAERLVGRGDMLLLGPASSIPQRIQGAWVEESEIHAIADFWRTQTPDVEAFYDPSVVADPGSDGESGSIFDDDEDGGDDLLKQAWELVVRSQLGSTSMLQRKLRVGFARAGRLMDLLEAQGVVGPSEGSKARTVLMSPEELEDLIESGSF